MTQISDVASPNFDTPECTPPSFPISPPNFGILICIFDETQKVDRAPFMGLIGWLIETQAKYPKALALYGALIRDGLIQEFGAIPMVATINRIIEVIGE